MAIKRLEERSDQNPTSGPLNDEYEDITLNGGNDIILHRLIV